jgi:DNA-binding NtrC family response regulator
MMNNSYILIIEEEPSFTHLLNRLLTNEGYKKTIFTPREKISAFMDFPVDFILFRVNSEDDIHFVKKIRSYLKKVPLILVSSFLKPLNHLNYLHELKELEIDKIISLDKNFLTILNETLRFYTKEKLKSIQVLKDIKENQLSQVPFVMRSKVMQKFYEKMMLAIKSDVPLLITGESGTGKQIVSKHINAMSNKKGPFVEINCASIPATLMESEFFGYQKGAFSGANTSYEGKFSLAKEGTLLLDEIGELDLVLQSKLLNVVESRPFYPLGSNTAHYFTGRLIVATNKDLKQEVENKRFRKDLFYRLSVFPLHLPPLRERVEDIPLLVEHFLESYTKKYHKNNLTISKDGMNLLFEYPFEGNIRELSNILEQLVLTCESQSVISQEELLKVLPLSEPISYIKENTHYYDFDKIIPLKEVIREEEKRYLIKMLQFHKNISRLAQSLHVERSSLYRKLKQYNIHL